MHAKYEIKITWEQSSDNRNSLPTIMKAVLCSYRWWIRVCLNETKIKTIIRLRCHEKVAYACSVVCLSACLSVHHTMRPTKTAELVKVLFGVWSRVNTRNHVLGGGSDPLPLGNGHFWESYFGIYKPACSWYSQRYSPENSWWST